MWNDNTVGGESDRPDTANSGVNRRQYLSAIAIVGSSRFVPSVVAGGQNADDELFRETVDDGGGTVAVSDSGGIFAFGVDAGAVRAYTADDEYEPTEFALPDISPRFPASHVFVAEDSNQLVAAAAEDDTFGGGTLNGADGSPETDAEWAYKLPGLWDIGASNDLSTVAAVSYPLEGPGRVRVIQNGERAWEQPLENAAAWTVDVSENGEYIAVGCIGFDEGVERSGVARTGQPGIRIFAADGELLWRYETDQDVLRIGVNENSDVVVAGVGRLSTVAFDLEGNLRWEQNDAPAMRTLSGDGSVVIASSPVVAVNSSDGSTIWESDVSNATGLGDPISSSADGSRVAVSTVPSELVVLEDGAPIWEGQNERGPYYSAISGDGSTLGAMESSRNARSADLVGYRV